MNSTARLIAWNNALVLDPELDQPTPTQLIGTPAENVCEYAGRTCYESLGRAGRDSEAYHAHLLEVGHTSVYEHVNFAFDITIDGEQLRQQAEWEALMALCQRPGCWLERGCADMNKPSFTVVLNPRVLLDWERHGIPGLNRTTAALVLNNELCKLVLHSMPVLAKAPAMWCVAGAAIEHTRERLGINVCPTNFDELGSRQRFASFMIECSRGCSHELVRHRWQTAFSQHSTRYCDESQSPWIMHPLMDDLIAEDHEFLQDINEHIGAAKFMYHTTNRRLEERGVPLKQRRGASRWALGTALGTRLFMTASVAAWYDFIELRKSPAADAEIHDVAEQIENAILGLEAAWAATRVE